MISSAPKHIKMGTFSLQMPLCNSAVATSALPLPAATHNAMHTPIPIQPLLFLMWCQGPENFLMPSHFPKAPCKTVDIASVQDMSRQGKNSS